MVGKKAGFSKMGRMFDFFTVLNKADITTA